MRVIAIHNPTTSFEHRVIDEMHQMRARIFQGRLAWNVRCILGREYDAFDALSPTYIVGLGERNSLIACARLLPATGVTMLTETFPQLLRGGKLPAHDAMIESSRFCVDTNGEAGRGPGCIHSATFAMFAGIVEWSMLNGYSEIVTATDVRFERILRRAGWPLRRLGDPTMINETLGVAGVLPADAEIYRRLRPDNYSSSFFDLEKKAA